MHRNRLWSLYGGCQLRSASVQGRGLGVGLIPALGIAMHLVNEAFGLLGVFRFAGIVFVVISPIAGLDAWLATMRREDSRVGEGGLLGRGLVGRPLPPAQRRGRGRPRGIKDGPYGSLSSRQMAGRTFAG